MGDNGVFHRHLKQIRLRKFILCLPENIIFDDTVVFEFHQDAVPVHIQQLLRRVLVRQAELLDNLDRYLLRGEELVLNALLQPIDILFMDQSGAHDINANRASIPGGSDLLNFHQI